MKPYISVIIPTKNRFKILENTVENLRSSLSAHNFEIIVINDDKLSSLELDNATVINNQKNGAAAARNFGASHAKGDYLLFLDDDMVVNPSAINAVIECTLKEKKAVFLPNWLYPNAVLDKLEAYSFGRFLKKINYTSLKGWISSALNWEDTEIYQHDAIASYCFCVSKENFMLLGGYDENIPYAGFEDYDLSVRLKKQGFQFYILTQHVIIHNEIDRIELEDFLNRRERNGVTQRKAVEIGYTQFEIRYGWMKRFLFMLIHTMKRPILWMCGNFPNHKKFDKMYFKIASILIAYAIYRGYSYPNHKTYH